MALTDIIKLVGTVAQNIKQENSTQKPTAIKNHNVPQLTYTPTASQYDADIVGYQNLIGSYDNAMAGAEAGYQNIANMYNSSANAQNGALQQAMGATADQINSVYDNSARDYYRLYKTQQKALPENLSKAGVTGGASESSQLKLMNAYSDNLYKNESARDNALAGNTAEYQNKIAQNSIAAANQLAGYYNSYLNEIASINQQKAEAEAGLQQVLANQQAAAAVDKWNASVIDRVNQQLGREGGDTLWTYQTPDGKLHWTTYQDKADALSSLYDLEKHSSVKTTSSKKASSGGSSPASDKKSADNTYNNTLVQAKMRMLNDAWTLAPNQAGNSLFGATGAVNYVENSGLTNSQKDNIYKILGLA